MGSIGSVWLLRPDGTLWETDDEVDQPLPPLPPTEHMPALVAGAERFPWLAGCCRTGRRRRPIAGNARARVGCRRWSGRQLPSSAGDCDTPGRCQSIADPCSCGVSPRLRDFARTLLSNSSFRCWIRKLGPSETPFPDIADGKFANIHSRKSSLEVSSPRGPSLSPNRKPSRKAPDLDASSLARLGQASQSTRSIQISSLNLHHSVTALENQDVQTVGDLLDRIKSGFVKIQTIRPLARKEIADHLNAVAQALDDTGIIDWMKYSSQIGLYVLPSGFSGEKVQEILSTLPELCNEIIAAERADSLTRDRIILKKRVLSQPSDRATLDELGFAFGLSRERIRQIQESIVESIRRLIVRSDYRKCEIRVHPTISQALASLESVLSREHGVWRRAHWIERVATSLHASSHQIEQQFPVLLAILDCDEAQCDLEEVESLVARKGLSPARIMELKEQVEAMHLILCEQANAIEDVDLLIRLKKKLGKRKGLDLQDLPFVAGLCSTVERVDGSDGSSRYFARFECLKRRADQAVRILEMRGCPTPVRDISQEINRRVVSAKGKVASHRSLVNLLSSDKRVVPIGKTGFWALSTWGTETRPVVDLIEECLHRLGKPMTEQQIWSSINGLRPMSRGSISLLLQNHSDKFRKVGLRLWSLVDWRNASENHSLSHEKIGQFIESFFKQRGTDRVEFHLLRLAFMEENHVSSRSAQGVLVQHAAITTEKEGARKRYACFNSAWRQAKPKPPVETRNRTRRPNQKEIVSDAVRSKLRNAPRRELPLIQLAKEIERESLIPRATIYGIVAKLTDVETVFVRSGAPKLCKFSERKSEVHGAVVTPEESLCRFLQSVFSSEDLRRFVYAWPGVSHLRHELPSGSVSPSQYAFALVDSLVRYGVIMPIFDRLIDQVPDRRAEIEQLRLLFPA